MCYTKRNFGGAMKKLIYAFFTVLFVQSIASANFNDVLIADIQYDWIDKNEVQKEAIISEVHDILFENELVKQKGFKKQYKSLIKDKDYKNNYLAASAGYEEYKGNNISAFYYKNQKNIYMYALQDKKDLSKIYYYDALGHLRYIDEVYGEYPDYPYYSYQYRVSGTPVSAIYFASKDCQYMFSPKGEFKGVWYKHNMYDKHSKVILKRTTY